MDAVPDSRALATTDANRDAHRARVVESLVLHGDISALSHADRVAYYVGMCNALGLNPHAQPFSFLRLNGKEIMYANRGATDQLAAIYKLTREIIEGPRVMDVAGTKLVYAVCRATHPNGRVETATATVPLVDPVNVLMKCESKAKRRATLSILGLNVLDADEVADLPAPPRAVRRQRTARPVTTGNADDEARVMLASYRTIANPTKREKQELITRVHEIRGGGTRAAMAWIAAELNHPTVTTTEPT